jgi:hypothetical protein
MTHLFSSLPIWIYILFFSLIYVGYKQTRARKVSRFRITVLPAVMMSLSFYGVLHVAHSTGLAMAVWLLGIGAAFAINSTIGHGRGVVLHPDRSHYVVPGSLIPMMLIMSVFAAKFTLGYLSGSHMVSAGGTGFIVSSSAIAGLISGTFAARAVLIFRSGNASLNTPGAQEA